MTGLRDAHCEGRCGGTCLELASINLHGGWNLLGGFKTLTLFPGKQLVGLLVGPEVFGHRVPFQFSPKTHGDVSEVAGGDATVLALEVRNRLLPGCKAVKEISDKVKNDVICLDNFDDSLINDHLYTKNLPDVDLLIRTSGEKRLSNFLLWQLAYSELYFTDVLWPDFTDQHLHEAIENYQKRERRFGKTSEQLK